MRFKASKTKEYILSRMTVDETTGCWIYDLPLNKADRCSMSIANKTYDLGRLVWELWKNELPNKKMTIRHDCDNKRCFNPNHLKIINKPVTQNTNAKTKDFIYSIILVNALTGCWTTEYATEKNNGYAQISINGKKYWLHRLTWEIWNGPIVKTESNNDTILHKCHNRACINPDHLELEPAFESIDKDKFLTRVDIDENTGCWNAKTTLYRNKCLLRINGRPQSMHILAWNLWNGEIPNKLYLKHSCKNKKCCNPDHLFLEHIARVPGAYKIFKTKEYIYSVVDVNSITGCWNCIYEPNNGGYCVVQVDGEHYLMHRLAWEIWNGPIVDDPNDNSYHGTCVLHEECDNRRCCNPDHLSLGSHRDNMDDMIQKGRQIRGELSPTAKLTEEDVINIRCMYDSRQYTLKEIALKFGVREGTIYSIVHRKSWTHI